MRVTNTWIVVSKDALIIAQVWWRLLEAIVIREGSLNLVHIQRTIKVIKTVLLHIFIEKSISIHLMSIQSVVSNNIRIKFKTLRRIVLSISAIACSWITLYMTHLIIVHHTISSI